jgi:uncharacterized Fe-S cluster protein YjdI
MEESKSSPSEPRKRTGVEREYRNDHIVVEWESQYCIHVANCLMGNPQVFDSMRRPWIELDGADADEIAEVVMSCPTGALHFRRLDGGEEEPANDNVTVEERRTGHYSCGGPYRSLARTGEWSGRTRAWPYAAVEARRTSPSATGPTGKSVSGRDRGWVALGRPMEARDQGPSRSRFACSR